MSCTSIARRSTITRWATPRPWRGCCFCSCWHARCWCFDRRHVGCITRVILEWLGERSRRSPGQRTSRFAGPAEHATLARAGGWCNHFCLSVRCVRRRAAALHLDGVHFLQSTRRDLHPAHALDPTRYSLAELRRG